ncbi:MAG TPA: 2-oxo acid dehydrogenase subunit E2 [Myxococcales bacterium]|nr:2-oxo acid dehydrogenase subunit E2 [Myxococcales bacterium]
MPNLELTPKRHLSSFRKIAIGTWRAAYDPSVYGTLEVPMGEAMRYLEEFRARTGRRLTISHMMAKVAAMALKEVPDANAVLRWNRIYLRKRIGIFFQVVMTDEGEDKADLSGATLYDLEQKSLLQICDEFQAKVATVRRREDPALEGTRKTFLLVPYFLLNTFLRLISFLAFTLNLDLRWAGVGKDPFGSMMITNVGSLGLDTAYVPLVPFSRVPILLALGTVREQPLVRGGAVTVSRMMRVNATFDHRLIDGFHASVLCRVVRDWFEHPYERFDRLDQISAPAPASKAVSAPG